MVARTWHGAVPIEKSEKYLELLRKVGLGDYNKTPGNRGSFVLRRVEDGIVHFVLLSFWESLEAIENYAGKNIESPQYTDFDPDYLIELEPSVKHFAVYAEPNDAQPRVL